MHPLAPARANGQLARGGRVRGGAWAQTDCMVQPASHHHPASADRVWGRRLPSLAGVAISLARVEPITFGTSYPSGLLGRIHQSACASQCCHCPCRPGSNIECPRATATPPRGGRASLEPSARLETPTTPRLRAAPNDGHKIARRDFIPVHDSFNSFIAAAASTAPHVLAWRPPRSCPTRCER